MPNESGNIILSEKNDYVNLEGNNRRKNRFLYLQTLYYIKEHIIEK